MKKAVIGVNQRWVGNPGRRVSLSADNGTHTQFSSENRNDVDGVPPQFPNLPTPQPQGQSVTLSICFYLSFLSFTSEFFNEVVALYLFNL